MKKENKYPHFHWESPYYVPSATEGYDITIYPFVEYSIEDVIKSLENIRNHHPDGFTRVECNIVIINED